MHENNRRSFSRAELVLHLTLVASYVIALVAENGGSEAPVVLTEFERPEDLRDVADTPYILVSESSLHRDVAGRLSLLDTRDYSRHVLTPTEHALASESIFADPECQPATTLAPHGIDILRNTDEDNRDSWQVAVVNHYGYESIEFFVLSIARNDARTPTLSFAGCTRNLGEGDIHNSVSYLKSSSPAVQEESLAITLWFEKYYGWYGQFLFYWSFLDPFPRAGSGAVKLLSPGGTSRRVGVAQPLNGANGLIHLDSHRVLVALTSAGAILEVDVRNGLSAEVLSTNMPDNLIPGPISEVESSDSEVVLTRIDSALIPTALCYLTSWPLLCRDIKFSVLLAFVASSSGISNRKDDTHVVFSGSNQGFTTVGMIKDSVLYVGTLQFNRLLVVPGISGLSIP